MALEDLDIDWDYLLERIERLMDMGEEYLNRQLAIYAPDPSAFDQYCAFRWQGGEGGGFLAEIVHPDIPDPGDLVGIDDVLQRLRQNTGQFAAGHPANNVLLWGERGTGKSSAIKSLLREFAARRVRMVEVQKEDLYHLPVIIGTLRPLPYRFVLFCDDLSFDESEAGYRELKALLEGGLEARPENVLVYATSNRRHLMPERMEENIGAGEIHPEETVSEKLSLSDRFGIAMGFYAMSRETYLAIVRHLARKRGLQISAKRLDEQAWQWAVWRGARSGRVARQFVDDLTGRLALAGKVRKTP